MEKPLITIENLTFAYRKKAPVFSDFSLPLEGGKIIGLLGKNGTGKSTLLYLLSGLLRPQGGNIHINGYDVQRRPVELLSNTYLVPEEFTFPRINLKQYVQLYRSFYPDFSDDILESCLREFDLHTDISLGELSMGQKKKALVCFALATNTRLLMMDEPTNGLDIPSKSQFRKVIASGMTDEKTVIVSTHQVNDIALLLDHVTILDGNEVLINQSVLDITDKLYFAEQGMGTPPSDALYVQPSMQGHQLILPNTEHQESNLNIELLFNALLTQKTRIQQMFNENK